MSRFFLHLRFHSPRSHYCLLAFSVLNLFAGTNLAATEVVKPLFPVGLNHEFPQAAETFEEIRQLILDQYYTGTVTEEALYWAAIQGMLRHVSPPENPDLARIWTAEAFERVNQSLQGVDVSLGLQTNFNPNDGSLTVNEILPDSPGEGVIMPLDRILRVDGEPLKGLPVAEVNKLLRGEEGSSVTLTINRDVRIFDLTLTRQRFATKNLIVTALNEQVALVELRYFSSGISEQLREELIKLQEKGIRDIVLDLRNNSGGVFSEALAACKLFVGNQGITLRTYNRAAGLTNYASDNVEPFDFGIAVLANGGTASAAEIVVAALQDQGQAFFIGSKTFGKGVFEQTFTLENEMRVRFIIGAMYTPKGNPWQGKGIKPDFLIEQNTATVAALRKLDPLTRYGRDPAMITAVKLLNLNREEVE